MYALIQIEENLQNNVVIWNVVNYRLIMLRGVYLSTGHSYFRSCIDVDPTVSLSADGAPHSVGDTHSKSPLILAISQGHQGVRCLPWRGGESETL